jgi:hypothetical protein
MLKAMMNFKIHLNLFQYFMTLCKYSHTYVFSITYTSFQSLGVSPKIKLTNHEMMVASNLVEPSSIQVSWDDIGSDFVFEIFCQSPQIFSHERNLHKNYWTQKLHSG